LRGTINRERRYLSRVAVDYVYRIEQPHVSGQVAKVCERIAESELVPDALDPAVHAEVARAVEAAARAEGLARPERVPLGL
jgi:malic enzyme